MSGLTKAELQKRIESLQQDELKSLTYEGLASLIIEQGKNDAEWRREFKDQFNDFKKETKENFAKTHTYNEKQNGRQAAAMNKIAELERESANRALTCGLKVVELVDEKQAAKQAAMENQKDKRKVTRANLQWVVMALIAASGLLIALFL